MAIRIWQPKWYKFWCYGVKWNYSPQYTYKDDKNNSIKQTHRGYIVPRDANLKVKPPSAWYVFGLLIWISIVSLIFVSGYLIYNAFGVVGIFLTLALIILLKWLFDCITELVFGCYPRRM